MVRDGVAAGLLFALLLEWLRPLLEMSEWSGIYRISPFMLAFAFFVALDWLRLSSWIGWPLKVFACLSMVAYVFDSAAFAHPAWLLRYAELTMRDALAVWDNDFAAISPDNRTMLFLLGWSMMIHVIYASVVERKQALWFVAATLLYLLGLQLWPGVNTSNAIIRTVWFGFLLIALLQFSKLESGFALRRRIAGWPIGMLAAVPLLLAAAVAAGLWLPPETKSGVMKPLDTGALAERLASWNNGVSGGEFAGGGGTGRSGAAARTGYGGDDSVLGGPIRQDDSIAFTAVTGKLTYWRGEAKTFYTGKGWESGGAVDETTSPQPARSIEQEVTLVDPTLVDRLFAGGSVERVEELVARSGRVMLPEESVMNVYGSYLVTDRNVKDPLRYYRLKVSVPLERTQWSSSGEETQSRESFSEGSRVTAAGPEATASGEPTGADTAPNPDKFLAELQLPPGLPDRVRLLAETIVMDRTDDYGKADAVESFLKTNYTYSMDVPEPPKESADFADTFLFDGKAGYCDYFSTSMVVMLRSVGIPARWVKGFSPGEVTGGAELAADEGGGIPVTVRNLNAHSWVEAYIAGSGWMTFDPTPGNSVPLAAEPAFSQAVYASAAPSRETAAPAPGLSETIADWLQMSRERLSSSWEVRDWSAMMDAVRLPVIAAVLLITLLMIAAVRRMRSRTASDAAQSTYSHRYASGKRASAYRTLDKLWAALFRKLGSKKPALTVREYVESLPLSEVGKREALLDFVKQYEDVRYGGAPLPRSAKRNIRELWRKIKER
jgi:transglutaminase-like putative cysteine protease